MIWSSDREKLLAKRIMQGEQDAMQDFYNRFASKLFAVCIRYIGNEDDAKDVLHDCIIKIITSIEHFEYRGKGSLFAWTKRIAINQSLDFLRQRQKKRMLLTDIDISEDYVEEPDTSDIPPDIIFELIREMPDGYRTIFNLHVIENISHKEIAELLGIKEDSSASQLHRAKQWLAKAIKQYNK